MDVCSAFRDALADLHLLREFNKGLLEILTENLMEL